MLPISVLFDVYVLISRPPIAQEWRRNRLQVNTNRETDGEQAGKDRQAQRMRRAIEAHRPSAKTQAGCFYYTQASQMDRRVFTAHPSSNRTLTLKKKRSNNQEHESKTADMFWKSHLITFLYESSPNLLWNTLWDVFSGNSRRRDASKKMEKWVLQTHLDPG